MLWRNDCAFGRRGLSSVGHRAEEENVVQDIAQQRVRTTDLDGVCAMAGSMAGGPGAVATTGRQRLRQQPARGVPFVVPLDNRDSRAPRTTVSMLRSHPLFGPTLVATADLLALFLAWLAANALAPPGFPAVLLLPLAFVHQIVLSGHGLHSQLRYVGPLDLLRRVFWAWLRIALTLCLIGFFAPAQVSRQAALAFAGAFFLALVAVRFGSMAARRWMRQRGRNLRFVVVVGTGPAAARAARSFTADAGYGLRLAGFLGDGPVGGPAGSLPAPVLGGIADLERIVRHTVVDE